jgi:hypothetical protein
MWQDHQHLSLDLGDGQLSAVVVNRKGPSFKNSSGARVPVNQFVALPKNRLESIVSARSIGLASILVLQLALFPALARGRAASQDQQRQPLGSLTALGDMYVNDSHPPGESTIFSGDTLRTSQTGSATFTSSGKGSLKVSPGSELAFPGNPQYMAELKSGTVVMTSLSGPAGVNLRAGDFALVAVTQGEESTSKIEKAPDGSFLISCLQGSIGVIPIAGASGLFLQAGQSVRISPQGELAAVEQQVTPAPEPVKPAGAQKKSNTGWIILAIAGGGGAAGAAAALGHGKGSSPPVSPAARQ